MFWNMVPKTTLMTVHQFKISDHREAGPRFARHPSSQTIIEGNTAQFDCRVIGVSEPTVTW